MATEESPVVAFLGPKASFTHQATLSHFPESSFSLAPQPSIEDIFATVQSGAASEGVVPFENSSSGSVVFTLDLFADRASKYPDILVVGEIYLTVQHSLLGHKDSSSSSTNDGQFARIRTLYTHPQAWGQCKRFLGTQVRSAARQDCPSTSAAAELVASDPKDNTRAAIASKLAAKLYGLDILAEGIEDDSENSTRFLIIRHRERGAPQGRQGQEDSSTEQSKLAPPPSLTTATTTATPSANRKQYKALVSFKVASFSSPGALADCLAVFARHGLTLTSINSRPSGDHVWHYIFFVEFRADDAGGKGGATDQALEELGRTARGWRWLGTWEDMLQGPKEGRATDKQE